MAFILKKQGPCVLDATIFLLVHANFQFKSNRKDRSPASDAASLAF